MRNNIICAVVLGMALLTVPAYAQGGGRPMTEEEKAQFRKEIENGEWSGEGSRSAGYHYERRTDWEAVAKNPLAWICVGVIVLGALALRELGGMQASVNILDANNKQMRRSLEEEHDRLLDEEARSGRPFQFENPANARWWEEEARKRGRR